MFSPIQQINTQMLRRSRDLATGLFLTLSLLLPLSACDSTKNPFRGKDQPGDELGEVFPVWVEDSNGVAIPGALITGGMDWEVFRAETDSTGKALLPEYAYGQHARITAENHFPFSISSLGETTYVLTPTPKRMLALGSVPGMVVRFSEGTAITLEYDGTYHVYQYDDQQLTETAASSLPVFTAINSARRVRVYGDTLWVGLHDSEIVAFSLADEANPEEILRLNIGGYIGPFAVRDSVITVADRSFGPLRFFVFDWDGDIEEVHRIDRFLIKDMQFISNYLVTIGSSYNLPTIFDLEDPAEPLLVYNGQYPEYRWGFLWNNSLILVERWCSGTGCDHYILDLSDPSSPITDGSFLTDCWLVALCDTKTAIGQDAPTSFMRVLSGDMRYGFETVGVLYGVYARDYSAADPPFFIAANKMWVLVD